MADTKVVCTFVVLLHLTASLTKARINKLSKKSAAGENSLKALVAYNSINSYMNILLNFFFTSQVLFWLYYLSSVNNHHLLVSLTYYFPLNCSINTANRLPSKQFPIALYKYIRWHRQIKRNDSDCVNGQEKNPKIDRRKNENWNKF